MKSTKNLHVFAGPNGSGKSSIFQLMAESFGMGAFISADELQRDLETSEGVALPLFLPSLSGDEFKAFYSQHPLGAQADAPFPFSVRQDGRLTFSEAYGRNPQRACATAVLVDYLLARLVEAGSDISFEAVSSQPSLLALMRQATSSGYRIHLYYVCVASPEVSKQRVALRVTQGGLGLPDQVVVEEYEQSLASLKDAIALSDRAFLFDNTYTGASLKLEISHASEVIPHEPVLPEWITRNLPALVSK